ncbi:MAG: hypothetical protein KJ970_04860 [Candidatus Eisenbacteria bacterium]|uniref:Uncharacterized protein n=1 Tax=Eiseniibacteriota bacterium TaxID=2212470 RepID=A0A948RVB9_UNCEI|nr:hypothetical protein [Candidatus Eisenbacteria bacterium]MBU1950593.1 hypothetical protein [Candidatus Eisenbacteria bacterium]MBU2690238.1 hypothetical protein [Candidatus Eisenbacteria bacterium]
MIKINSPHRPCGYALERPPTMAGPNLTCLGYKPSVAVPELATMAGMDHDVIPKAKIQKSHERQSAKLFGQQGKISTFAVCALSFLAVIAIAYFLIFYRDGIQETNQASQETIAEDNATEKAAQIKEAIPLTTKASEKTSQCLSKLIFSWEADEFKKHREFQQTPKAFSAYFKGSYEKPKEFINGAIIGTDNFSIVSTKYNFQSHELTILLCIESIMIGNERDYGKPSEGNRVLMTGLEIPMDSTRAEGISQAIKAGNMGVWLVFTVRKYNIDERSLSGTEARIPYYYVTIIPNVLEYEFR